MTDKTLYEQHWSTKAAKESGGGANLWLREALQWLVVKAGENDCKIINADILIDGLKRADRIRLGDAEFEIHAFSPEVTNGG